MAWKTPRRFLYQAARLPTRREFFDRNNNNIVILEQCGICHEPFDATHQAAHVRSLKCQHVFAYECLQQWAESDQHNSNTCPQCREPLFIQCKKPKFYDGTRPEDAYEEVWATSLRRVWLVHDSDLAFRPRSSSEICGGLCST
jgi:hypothetical protein